MYLYRLSSALADYNYGRKDRYVSASGEPLPRDDWSGHDNLIGWTYNMCSGWVGLAPNSANSRVPYKILNYIRDKATVQILFLTTRFLDNALKPLDHEMCL